MRTGNHEANPLRQLLMHFTPQELSSQPLPTKDSTDDRYEMLNKLQGILKTLGYRRHRRAGRSRRRARTDQRLRRADEKLVWPMLVNKFLKHPGLGVKLMLPVELTRFIDREERDFYQRARLDKQNMIPAFEWTGEALYDVTNARIRACSAAGRNAEPAFADRAVRVGRPTDRIAPLAPRAAAAVQVPVPAAGRPLQRPQRRKSGVADFAGDV